MQPGQKIRSSYVVEIVKEVDPVFEEKLIEINDEIKEEHGGRFVGKGGE